jgi:hypothetical protein
MTASNHGRRTAVKATAGIAVFLAVAEAANLAAHARGVLAGVAVVAMAFLACWIVTQLRQLRHPAPARRRPRGRDPEPVTAPAALAESQEPARIAA